MTVERHRATTVGIIQINAAGVKRRQRTLPLRKISPTWTQMADRRGDRFGRLIERKRVLLMNDRSPIGGEW
ncbi:hypothetical protein WI664_05465 [Vibrio cholerae]